MNIGQASAASGVSTKMIRYYERATLIKSADRSPAGYRVYTESDIHTLQFICRARDLGFSVSQISDLLALWNDRERASHDVKDLAMKHVKHLCAKVAEMEAMIATLKHLVENCTDDDCPDCPILRDLAEGRRAECASAPENRFGATRVQ